MWSETFIDFSTSGLGFGNFSEGKCEGLLSVFLVFFDDWGYLRYIRFFRLNDHVPFVLMANLICLPELFLKSKLVQYC